MRSDTHESRRWIGRVLRDKWRIDARISRGGVGTVYAATHKNNGSRAAIKVLHPEFSRDVDTRSRFLQEGYAANQVNHPGVVRILDDDTSEDGHAYLVMELLEGELLETRRIRKGGRLPLQDVYEVGEQLLDVLAAAHEKGIVHRDIKPDNLFITHEGRLKVLDFGFAQMKSSFRTEQTATGFLLGTPGFMSPEQAIGNRPQIDAQTDIWAAGATLFTLASGEPVHAGESAAEMLVAAANFPPRSLATVTNGLNPRLVKVIDRAVAFEKTDRWPNARSMQVALREASGMQPSGQVSRRSIPDDGRPYESESEIEELDAADLDDAKGSWSSPGAERTVISKAKVPDSAQTTTRTGEVLAPGRRSHPADDDGPTIMSPSRAGGSGGMFDPSHDSGTLIMESPAAAREDASNAYSALRRPSSEPPKAFGRTMPLATHQQQQQQLGLAAQSLPPPPHSMAPAPSQALQSRTGAQPSLPPGAQPQPFPSNSPRAMSASQPELLGNDLAYGAGATQRRQQYEAPRPNGVLVFIAVAVCTMIAVIVVGLIVLSLSD